MLLCISDKVSVYLEYPSEHGKQHQGLDYIISSNELIALQ